MSIKNASLLFPVIFATAFSIGAAEKDLIAKTFDVRTGGKLEMQVDRGSIKVLTADSDKVDIKVVRELKRGSDDEARAAYDEHKIEMSQDGDTVLIRAEAPGFLKGLKNGQRNLVVEYTISVPSKFNLDLHTSGGTIDVAELEGSAELHTAGGNITTAAINGPVEAHTAGGNIRIQSAKTTASLQTSGGNITVGNVQGDLVAKTTGGNITTSEIAGSTDVSTSGGHITVKSAKTALKARTTGGNIKAEIAGLSESSSLKSTGGNIDLILADKTAANLTAKTTGGQVRSEIEGEFNKQRTKLVAQVNGGGPELVLETTGGNVKITEK